MGEPRNCTWSVKGNKLIIVVDISAAQCEAAPMSMSGKSPIVGTSGGFQVVEGGPPGWKINLSLNVSNKRK